MSDEFVAEEPPWGGKWPDAGLAIDVPTPAPGEHWRTLRRRLGDIGFEVEPNLHADLGLVGYSVRTRNAMVGVGIVRRQFGLHLAITAVLCRGMDREPMAMLALDQANACLRLGQLLYYPGPPAELAFYASTPWELLDDHVFAAYLGAVLREVEETCFPAVALVQGFHPSDMTQFWEHLENMVEAAVRAANGEPQAQDGQAADSPPAEPAEVAEAKPPQPAPNKPKAARSAKPAKPAKKAKTAKKPTGEPVS